jgi:ribonuclease G
VVAPDTVPVNAPANTAPPVAEAEDVPVSAAPAETPETEVTEDGPDGASASYRVGSTTPSAFRFRRARTPEAVAAPVAEQIPGKDAHEAPASAPEDTQPAMPAAVQGPAEMETVKGDESHQVESSKDSKGDEDDEEGVSGEDVGEDADEDANDATLHAFAPGTGLLEEELIDEEEAEVPASRALLDENEFDELVEETLDVQMDGGLLSDMVRDAHIEERIRYKEDQNGQVVEEEDADEEELGEEEDEFAPEASLEDADVAIAEETPEGSGQEGVAQPAQPRTGPRGRGRQSSRRRPGGYASGHGRRATAQTTNMPAITELLKAGQEILVQIAKEPMARKGARITSHIALPGRFLVFMPTVNHVGVSRKIASDEERQRLKHILISEKGNVGGGFIVRTAAATASEEDLRADIRFLLNLWADIRQRSESSKPPALIYHDLNLVERVLRDQVSENFSTIWVDTESDYERVLRFLERFQPSLVRHVKLYTKETPLFEQFGIQEEINKALSSKVWLKSGGSIVINQTEALVAIDVNTGKYVGKTARLEDTILKTNLDAIPEIVRQVRLRDLGGIIIIDFIDMDERRNRQKVMQALEEELHTDRAPSKVLQFNDFGLVAITRKRVKQSLERTLSTPCAVCSGTGMVKSPVTVCNEIYIELRKMYRHLERGDILLRVHPEVVKQLKLNNAHWISEMEELSGKTILVKSDPSLQPEQFDIQ